jgi:hypothetical protein
MTDVTLNLKAEQKRLSFTSEPGKGKHGMLVFPFQEYPHETADTQAPRG